MRRRFHHDTALDLPIAPAISGDDAFFGFCQQRPGPLRRIETAATEQAALPTFRLEGVSLTFNVDVDYAVVRTQLTQNVAAIVEGSDRSSSRPMWVRRPLRSRRYADAELARTVVDCRRPDA